MGFMKKDGEETMFQALKYNYLTPLLIDKTIFRKAPEKDKDIILPQQRQQKVPYPQMPEGREKNAIYSYYTTA